MTAPWYEAEGIDDETFWGNVRAAEEPPAPALRNDGGRADWFALTRAHANTVLCRDCRQPAGETCVDRASSPPRPLRRFPAHTHRINDAGAPP
jgi:hypothetical protein